MQLHCPRPTHGNCRLVMTCGLCGELFHEAAPEWPDLRVRSAGPGQPLVWLCPHCAHAHPLQVLETYHARHSCHHGAFWENPLVAQACSRYPCPWCGGEERTKPPQVHYFDYGPPYGRVYADLHRLGPGDPPEVAVTHTPDHSCCASVEVEARA